MGRKIPPGSLLALVLLLSLISPLSSSPAQAIPPSHPMQGNTICGLSPCTSTSVGSVVLRAQSFTASDGYNLTRISLRLSLTSGLFTGPVTLALRADFGGNPGVVLASSRGSTPSPAPVWVGFNFSSPIPLTKNNVYWMVANTSGVVTYDWTLSGTDTYPGGMSAQSNGVGWTMSPLDQFFQTFGYVDSRIAVALTVDLGKAQPLDTLHYTIYLNNTGNESAPRVWINDTLPRVVSYQSDNATASGGTKTGNYNWSFANVGQGVHYFLVTVKVNGSVAPGTQAINTVSLDYANSTGARQPRSTARALTIIGLREKTLYLHEAGRTDLLDARPPTSTENCNGPGAPCDYDGDSVRGITLPKGASHDWKLDPALAGNFTIFTMVNVTLWLDDRGFGGSDQINAALYRNDTTSLLASATLSFKADVQDGFQPFSLVVANVNATLPRGSTILLRLTVPLTSNQSLQVAYDATNATAGYKAFQSRVVIETPTYIRITSLQARDARGVTASFAPLENATFEAVVSDPLGAYDIVDSGTTLDLYDPSSGAVLSGIPMALQASDPGNPPAWKEFSKKILMQMGWAQGSYAVRVTATEGNLVKSSATGSLSLRGPVFKPAVVPSRAFAPPGAVVTYMIYFNNTGTLVAPRVWVNDSLSSYVSYQGDNATASGGTKTGNYNWSFGNVTPGSHFFRLNVTLNLGIPGATVITNLAGVAYVDQKGNPRGPARAQANVTTNGPFFAFALVGAPTYVGSGDTITYTIFLNNTGNQAAGKLWINDTLPSSVSFGSHTANRLPSFTSYWLQGSVVHFNFTNVGPGPQNFTMTVSPAPRLPGGTAIVNSLEGVYLDGANQPVGPFGAAATSYAKGPQVSLTLNVSTSSTDPGAKVLIRLAYSNRGPGVSTAYDVAMAVTLGPELVFLNASGGGTYDPSSGRVRWFFPLVYVGDAGNRTVNATLKPGTPDRTSVQLLATATFFDEFGNPMPSSASTAGFTVTAPVLSLALLPGEFRVLTGGSLNYSLLLNNTGTGRAGDVWINASLNPNTVVLSVTQPVGEVIVLPPPFGNRVALHLRNLAPGLYAGTIQVQVRAGLRDGLVVTNGVAMASTDGSGNPLPPSTASAQITIVAPRMGIVLAMDRTAALPGGTANLSYRIEGLGNGTAFNAWLNITLPRELVLVGQVSDGEWTQLGAVLSWHFRGVKPGSVLWVHLEVRVGGNATPGLLVPLTGTLTYTDSFGFSQESFPLDTATFQILAPPGTFPWVYLLGLLILPPIGLYLRRRMPPVREVFLVYRNGCLLVHQVASLAVEKDEDILTGMFTAVQDFIRDAFSTSETRELKSMKIGTYGVDIQRGQLVYLAALYSGASTPELRRRMERLVRRIEGKYYDVLQDWTGLMTSVEGMEGELKGLFRGLGGPHDPKKA